MNITCKDRDRVFEDRTEAEWSALESHANTCAVCAEEIAAWKDLSVTAAELRDYSENPALWQRIQRSLREESARTLERKQRTRWAALWQTVGIPWQTAAASAFALILIVGGGWFYLYRPSQDSSELLKSKALSEVERTESAYVQAIAKLDRNAQSRMENPETPLLASYREKLLVLNSAIDDLRTQAGLNPSNTHLRYQLLAMYQEKQRTLEEILEDKQ
ncbi:MAG TPA: anti-sigma factor [Candidatus Acidoferrum sp.]|jgi:hypothetical protein